MIIVVILIVGIGYGYLAWLGGRHDLYTLNIVSAIASGLCGVAVACMVVFALFANIGINGTIAKNKAKYDLLVYQYENEFYENDNDIGKFELLSEIREWNEDLAEGKANQHDFWIGVFYPDIFDEFEFIDIGQLEARK